MIGLQTPIRRQTLSAQVAGQVEALITSGEWTVGTRIPPENDLVTILGVSRNTVREALRSLVHTGLLEARPGEGTFVAALSELALPFVRRAQRATLQEAVEVRAMLERHAARAAALQRSSSDVERLRELLARLREAIIAGDRATCDASDEALHRMVVACTGNALLIEIYEHLGGALKLSVSPELWDQALAVEELDHHAMLVDAIAAGDASAAEEAASILMNALSKALLP